MKQTVPVVTLALGLAVQEAIQQTSGLRCDLRWPNDLLAGDQKCCGILVQHHGARIVAGIGVNVNQTAFPEELVSTATSLRIATGSPQDREVLLTNILAAIETYTALLAAEGVDPILRLFTESSSYVRGRRVDVDGVLGWTDGLDEAGFLWLRTDSGVRKRIITGGVRPA